jgi:hypothetical protein
MTHGPLGNATLSRFTTVISSTCMASPMQSGNRTAPLDARAGAAITVGKPNALQAQTRSGFLTRPSGRRSGWGMTTGHVTRPRFSGPAVPCSGLPVPIFNPRADLVAPHAHGEKLRRRFVLRAGHS